MSAAPIDAQNEPVVTADFVQIEVPSGSEPVVGDEKTLKQWCKEMEKAYPWYRPSNIAPKDSVLIATAMILIDLANEAKELNAKERSGEPNEHLTITLDHVEVAIVDGKTTAKIIVVDDKAGVSTTTSWENDKEQLLALAKHLLTDKYLGKHVPKDLKDFIKEVDMKITALDAQTFVDEMSALVKRERSNAKYAWHVCTAVAVKAKKPALHLVRIAAGAGAKQLCNIQ
ncbi:hypothetical protein B0O80DRAFT_424258 [Mortierella sp. GBAus27b]|nr:hypothetical protein BGX31_009302 [Mortierella sp. GBA43]KAI8358182.1 hypothetical protein B0O80DRAFT_424258 [Mortierella sp. GBAus27b]